jgi:hypothetical protein
MWYDKLERLLVNRTKKRWTETKSDNKNERVKERKKRERETMRATEKQNVACGFFQKIFL